MRFVPTDGQAIELGKSAFIVAEKSTNPYSCSFVEFDGRGDFIDFNQHQHCWGKVREYAKAEGVLLVIYCHGWKNNSQSGDVLRFNSFLSKLAKSPRVAGSGLRVHGVFLSWQGNLFKPNVQVDDRNEFFRITKEDFGSSIVDPARSRRLVWPVFLPEQFSYYDRKQAAEHRVSGIALTRAVYTYAGVAKRTSSNNSHGVPNRVFMMGHSFGALMLEQSVLQGSVGALATQWDWFQTQDSKQAPVESVLPFDFMLLVNSAAPAIYSKQMRDFLASHDKAMRKGRWEKGERPLVVSLTSDADKATRYAHAVANALTPLYPSMQRNYDSRMLKTEPRGQKHPPVHQSEFYKTTPGHNPFLVNRWIMESSEPLPSTGPLDPFDANLQLPHRNDRFYLSNLQNSSDETWRISKIPPGGKNTEISGMEVDPWDGAYWFVRCDKRHIRNHGDIWSQRAMEIYAALYRMSWSQSED